MIKGKNEDRKGSDREKGKEGAIREEEEEDKKMDGKGRRKRKRGNTN